MTKRRSRNGTDSHPHAEARKRAAEQIVAGYKIQDIATELGLARETVSRWRSSDPEFQAMLNALQNDVSDAALERLRCLATEAVDTIAAVMRDTEASPRDRLTAACKVLDRLGIVDVGTGGGLEDPEAIEEGKRRSEALDRLFSDPFDGLLIEGR